MVSSAVAHSTSLPAFTAKTSAAPMLRLVPACLSVPRASSASPTAGATTLKCTSMVELTQPSGKALAAARPAA